MKICFIAQDIFSVGGIQRVVSVLANELVKENDVDVLCISRNDKIDRKLYNLDDRIGIEVNHHYLRRNLKNKISSKVIRKMNLKTNFFRKDRYLKILSGAYWPKEVQQHFISYLNEKKYDVVIGVGGDYSLLLAMIAPKINSRTIGWQHNSYDAYFKNQYKYYWNQDILFKEYLPSLDEYLVLAKYDKEMFKKEMDIDCEVMYNPRSFDSREKSNLQEKRFLAAGRFNYQKGFDMLVKSFNEFSKKDSQWKLTMVGDGEEKDVVNKLIEKYGLGSRIEVKNFTDNIKDYFLHSSILLMPSRWEGMPMTALESIEMGVPVISYNITGVQSIIENGTEGILVEKFDTDKFAEAMFKLSSNYNLRCEMSKNCIEKSECFSLDTIINQWTKLLDSLNVK